MSHIAKIQAEIKNLGCLEKAFNHFGWKHLQNTTVNTYPNDPERNRVYQHVFRNRVGTGYDIGVDKEEENYQLYGDFYTGSIEKELGYNVERLKQQYNFEVTKGWAENEDLEYTTNKLENGDIELLIQD